MMKTLYQLQPILQGVALWCLAAFSIIGSGVVRASEQQMKDPFQHVCYRREPVLAHVRRTQAWKEGRRDVLDYGCGSGLLALDLAEQGAHSVVAVDLGDEAVQAANERLKHLKKAYARKPQLFAGKMGHPGRIGYNQQFDIVVSYMGALTERTTTRPKIASQSAMQCAVRATRENGCVIVAEFQQNVLLLYLAASLVIPVSIYAPEFVANLNWWQVVLLGVLLTRIGGLNDTTQLAPMAARNIVNSIWMKKWRFSSIVWSIYYVGDFFFIGLQTMFENRKKRSHVRAELHRAGLVDVKVAHRLLYGIYEAADKKNKIFVWVARVLNFLMSPTMLVIYEGTKAPPKDRNCICLPLVRFSQSPNLKASGGAEKSGNDPAADPKDGFGDEVVLV